MSTVSAVKQGTFNKQGGSGTQLITGQVSSSTGTVPAGNNTPFALFNTTYLPAGTFWKWTYQQRNTATGAPTASAWGILVKDATGAIDNANLAGPLAVEQILVGGVAADAPQTITYAAQSVGATTNVANTAVGQTWLFQISQWI